MTHKRTKWTGISGYTRKCVLVRDKNRCIICGSNSYLTLAHVFISRAHGGKGSKDNLVVLCRNCHQIMDNPIGNKQNELSKKYLAYCKKYLINVEEITNLAALLDRLKYKKGL